MVIPYDAVLYAADGSTFTYTSPKPHVFVRAPISVRNIRGDRAVLSAGPPAGTPVVTVGSQELFGERVRRRRRLSPPRRPPMRWIIGSSLRFRFLVVAAAAAMMVFGVGQLGDAPPDVFPEFAPPRVEIQTVCLGLSAAGGRRAGHRPAGAGAATASTGST